ncbi:MULTISPECIES: sugar phosphate isomerase/epimerase [Paenibacillus]|uniref:Xylose isomerase-like TIM barrel domain-containing protein n=1 Tax=Paenibacillus borealis TaxID=160799 RepID=A0ABX3GVR5_PAEBO|nr:sugar phosphate isomerase/epimerase [Paenibacillus borealis]OMD36385.1 hypothetical protein BSK56_32200 [Paenibacillus borealis]
MVRKLPMLGLKCSINEKQILNRLFYSPDLIELHLNEYDLNNLTQLSNIVRYLKSLEIKVYLHQPHTFEGKPLDILSNDLRSKDYYVDSLLKLQELSSREEIYCVIHPHYSLTKSGTLPDENKIIQMNSERMYNALWKLSSRSLDRILWENSCLGIFSTENPLWTSHIVKPLGIRLCYDISHAFIGFNGCQNELEKSILDNNDQIDYFHVVDSRGERIHDSLALGKGKIKWSTLYEYIVSKNCLFEIGLSDQFDCKPMIDSFEYLAFIGANESKE